MKIITNYGEFLNENIDTSSKDIFNILYLLKDTPTEDIIEFRDSLKDLSLSSEKMNENIITDFISKLKLKFKNAIDDRIWNYLINRKAKFYLDLADKLNLFDLTSLDDVIRNYPGFKLESIYLAGGMDKAADVGAGWRSVVENEFENYPGKETGLPKITIVGFGEVEPKRIVNDKYVDMFIENPEKIKKLYNKPLILNPIRKEVDRTKDLPFFNAIKAYKAIDYKTEPEDYEPTITDLRKTLSRSIEVGDEHLVRVVDCIFLGFNQSAAAGTFGELQTQSFMNKPTFVWMTDPEWTWGPTEKDKMAGFSPWSFPHFTKLARNKEEMKVLVKTLMNYSK